MTTRSHPHLMAEISRKEVGPVHHFLDAVWRYLPASATGAVGVSVVAAVAIQGQAMLYALAGSLLVSQATTGALGLKRWRTGERHKRIYDSPRCQAYLRRLEARTQGVVASQRGTVWVVTDPGRTDAASRVQIMGQREYDRYRAQELAAGRPIDEVRVHPRRGCSTIRHSIARNGRELASQEIDMSKDLLASGRIERWLKQAPTPSQFS
ncbi:hypothetical protein V5F53_02665 [Xanthobacter sp. V4C-4]|uniref:hypothetical protein n=1 Tax=Xanthobacter cornucopiae TaxID=3119924 RepID=UPI00372A9793